MSRSVRVTPWPDPIRGRWPDTWQSLAFSAQLARLAILDDVLNKSRSDRCSAFSPFLVWRALPGCYRAEERVQKHHCSSIAIEFLANSRFHAFFRWLRETQERKKYLVCYDISTIDSEHFNSFICSWHPIYNLRTLSFVLLPPSSSSSDPSSPRRQAPGASPLPTTYGTRLRFFARRLSAVSSLVDSHRIAATQAARRPQRLNPFGFLDFANKLKSPTHVGFEPQKSILIVAFADDH